MEESKIDNNNSKNPPNQLRFHLGLQQTSIPRKVMPRHYDYWKPRIEYCIEKKPKSNRSLQIFELADTPINIDELLRR